jgi:hypothetical protein
MDSWLGWDGLENVYGIEYLNYPFLLFPVPSLLIATDTIVYWYTVV